MLCIGQGQKLRLRAPSLKLQLWACFALSATARSAYAELRIVDPSSPEEAIALGEQAARLKKAFLQATSGKPITQENNVSHFLGFLIALPDAEKVRLNIYEFPTLWIANELEAGRSIPVHRAYLKAWQEMRNEPMARKLNDAEEKWEQGVRQLVYDEESLFPGSDWKKVSTIARGPPKKPSPEGAGSTH